ncbi:hypothetical protein [Streptomyces sp. NPDC101237]|uniref:hypothetical protein n=1 Tax=Streptomyces sp. NPDC101237 TaxID=3366139 RepID=UPI0037FFDE07
MPGIHFSLRMTDAEIGDLAAIEIDELVTRLVPEVFALVQGSADHTSEQARALAQLHLLTYLRQAVDTLEVRAAHAAADAGAGYPQIGRASNMTRQGARRRWPGLLHQSTDAPLRPTSPKPGSP